MTSNVAPCATGGQGKQLASRHAAVLEAAGDLALFLDRDGDVVEVSEGVRVWLRSEARDFLGTGLFGRLHVADRPLFLRTFHAALRDPAVAVATVRLRSGMTVEGEGGFEEPVFIWVDMRLRRLDKDAGNAAVAAILRDASEIKELERNLAATRAEAQMAAALKDRLLANVSHELRTPLNAILGFSEMLGDSALAPAEAARRSEYARIINTSAHHLLSVVNLLLDMSRMEAGRFELTPQLFPLDELVGECCEMLRLRAEAGKVRLSWAALGEGAQVVADKRACRQILLNLISNAVKFTPEEGHVHVSVDREGETLRLVIQDTGIGISPEDLPHLGQPFFQVRSGYDRHYEGAGLGLSLVRGLVDLHGGSILLESSPGVGTRVTLRLPTDCRAHARTDSSEPIRLETATKTIDAAAGPSTTWDCKERRIA